MVEGGDVVDDGQAGRLARGVAMLIDEFGLQRMKDTLGDGVVEAAARPAGTQDESPLLGELVDPE